MNKIIAALLGAVGALVLASPGHAGLLPPPPHAILQATAFSQHLQPEAQAALDGEAPQAQVERVQLRRAIHDLTGRRHYDRRRYYHPRRYYRHGRRY